MSFSLQFHVSPSLAFTAQSVTHSGSQAWGAFYTSSRERKPTGSAHSPRTPTPPTGGTDGSWNWLGQEPPGQKCPLSPPRWPIHISGCGSHLNPIRFQPDCSVTLFGHPQEGNGQMPHHPCTPANNHNSLCPEGGAVPTSSPPRVSHTTGDWASLEAPPPFPKAVLLRSRISSLPASV